MRKNRLFPVGLAVLGCALAWNPGVPAAGAKTSAAGVERPAAGAAEEVAPYSKNPSETRPFAACPPPTRVRASCFAAIVPTEGGEPVVGPALEGEGELGGFSPFDLRSAYGLPAGGGEGMTIAITVAYDNPNAEADLDVYRDQYNLAPCTAGDGCFKKVNQDGEAANYPKPDTGWALESSLDLDMVSAACLRCHIILVEADSNNLEDLAQAVETAAALGADVISNSWGTEEFSEEESVDSAFDNPGIPTLFASGDDGYGVSYPAASPDAIGVGGTSLSKSNDPRGWDESAWSGAGSGCSAYEAKPGWQRDDGCPNRTVADVAAVSDPQTPVSVYDTYGDGLEESGWELVGGTSAATPLLAAVEARSTAAFRDAGPSGFAHAGGGLFDVTDGENGPCASEGEIGFEATYLCQADTGYDGPSGWGTPDGPLSLAVAITEGATVGSTEEATVHGAVDPKGLPTNYRFEYGETTAYGHSAPISGEDVGSGADYVDVSKTIDGLEGQTPYHYRLAATNTTGTFYGVDRTFGTTPPTATTGSPIDVHAFDGTLRATVNPEGLDTTYYFEYGPTTSYGFRAPAKAPDVGSGLADVPLSTYVYGLQPGRTYHFRVVAKNSAGKTFGADRFLITEPSRWTAETLPQPPESGSGHEAFGVSCLEPDDCVAVGGNWSLEVHTGVTLAERWDGSGWTVMETPNPPGLDDGWQHDWYALLRGVSCASPSDCIAVGRYRDADEKVKPLAEHWDGSDWTLLSPPAPAGDTGTGFEGVSCVSATDCTAVGYTTDGSETVRTLAEHWDGSDWSIVATPTPSGAVAYSFAGVSCSSAGACTAVGMRESNAGVEATLAERWNGGAWTIQTTVNPPGNEAWNSLQGVSCPTATACTAVGSHVEKQGTDFVGRALAESWNGTTWSTQPVPQPLLSQSSGLDGVSCATSSSCTAVGSYGAPAGDDTYAEVFGVRWDGASWSLLDMVGLADPAGYWHERWLHAVSCAEPEGCNAVGRGLAAPQDQLAPYEALGEHEATPPYASFSTAPDTPFKGDPVAFDAGSTIDPGHAIESYEWEFGDGESGSGATPSHAYEHAGDYAATLTVTDDLGRSGEISRLVTVTGTHPLASYTFTPVAATATEPVEFDAGLSEDPDGQIAAYEWAFGDGTQAEGPTPSHTYAHAGSYQAKLTVTDDEGLTATVTHQVAVADAPPLAAFAVGTAAPTATRPTDFDGSASSDPDGTVESYAWDFGDGSTGSGATPSHVFARGGDYEVTLKVTDDEGAAAEATHTVSVAGLPPLAAFAVGTQSPTAFQRVAFDGSLAGDPDGALAGYSWDFGDGTKAAGATPSHAYSRAGQYPVTLVVTDDEGLKATVTHTVSVAPATLSIRRLRPGCNGRIVLVLDAPGAGRLAAVATAAVGASGPAHSGAVAARKRCKASRARHDRRHAAPRKRFSYGTGSAEASTDGQVRLTIAPLDSALRTLRRSGRLRITITITFEPPVGERLTEHRTVLVHR